MIVNFQVYLKLFVNKLKKLIFSLKIVRVLEFVLAYCALIISLEALEDNRRQQNLDKLYESISMNLVVNAKISKQTDMLLCEEETGTFSDIHFLNEDIEIKYLVANHQMVSRLYINYNNIYKEAMIKLLDESEEFSKINESLIDNMRVMQTYKMLIDEGFQVEQSKIELNILEEEYVELKEKYLLMNDYNYPALNLILLNNYYEEELKSIKRTRWFIFF